MKIRSLLPFARRDSVSGLENPNVDIVAALIASQEGAASSGVSMTPLKAFRLAAVYACVRVIAESVASLPIEISRADASGEGRELVRDDPRWAVLNEFPNPEMTGVELMENWVAHALLWGTGYLFAVYNGAGQVAELWPLRPDVTFPRRTPEGRLYYETELGDGEKKNVPADRVIPLKALLATSPVMNARDVLANAAAAQEYASRFWQNNARPGGIIELPDSMDEDEMDDFTRRWKSGHEGLKRAQLVGILTGGAKWTDVGISPAQAQFIETRQFGTREIARMYGVPLHRVGDALAGGSGGGSGMGNSLEQQSIEFVTYTLRSWIIRAEQAFRTKLFASKSDLASETYPRFNFTELMRGDVKSRYEAYAIGIQWGILNRAEPRRMEGLPAVGDEQLLDEFLVPLNMIPSSKIGEIDVNGSKSKGGGGGDANKDGGGTQPTTGSDGSTPQANSLALLAAMVRDKPELAQALADYAIERAGEPVLELPASTSDVES